MRYLRSGGRDQSKKDNAKLLPMISQPGMEIHLSNDDDDDRVASDEDYNKDLAVSSQPSMARNSKRVGKYRSVVSSSGKGKTNKRVHYQSVDQSPHTLEPNAQVNSSLQFQPGTKNSTISVRDEERLP